MKRVRARFWAGALCVLTLASRPPAGAQTPDGVTDVASVTVVGSRRPPPEILGDLAACLDLVKDPYMAALVADGHGRIFVDTRPPRNPDYSAPPRTPPGSARPPVMSLLEYERYVKRTGRLDVSSDAVRRSGPATMAQAASALRQAGGGMAGSDGVNGNAIAACLGHGESPGVRGEANPFAHARGVHSGPSQAIRPHQGRWEMRLHDRALPLAFALFQDGRYDEALVQFKAYDRKLGGEEAPLMIGKIYLFGLRDKSDPVEGVKWLKRVTEGRFNAAYQTPKFDPRQPERNTPFGEAAMILADIYRDGRSPIARDPAQSRKLLEKAAYAFGYIPAAKTLGDIYYEGRDTPRDLQLAFKHYMQAARFAHVPAMNAVAQMYAAGEVAGGPDLLKAAAWRNEAAKANDPAALYSLAVAYDHGEGVATDPQRALSLYKLAAMNGEAAGMTALGTYFYAGEAGIARNPVVARGWFEQAALAGDPEGMFNLAAMMAKGEGGEPDQVRAWGWLKIAQKLGHANAAAAARAIEAEFSAADRAGVGALMRSQQ